MDQSKNPLILKGQSIYKFLQELHLGNNGAYPHSKMMADDEYSLFNSNIKNLRDFLSQGLKYVEIRELLNEQDQLTQSRIRNIISPYYYFEQVDIVSSDLQYNIERKELNHEKHLESIKLLTPLEQEYIWYQRVKGSIWNIDSGTLITQFVLNSISLITTLIAEGKIISPKEESSYEIGGVYIGNSMKEEGIGFNIHTGIVTCNGEYIDTLKGMNLDFFKTLFALSRNKRVAAKYICKAMRKLNVGGKDDYSAYLRTRLSKLPNVIKGWIDNGPDGYILHDK